MDERYFHNLKVKKFEKVKIPKNALLSHPFLSKSLKPFLPKKRTFLLYASSLSNVVGLHFRPLLTFLFQPIPPDSLFQRGFTIVTLVSICAIENRDLHNQYTVLIFLLSVPAHTFQFFVVENSYVHFYHCCQLSLSAISALLIHSSPYFYASKCLHLFWQVTQAWFVIKLSDNHYSLVYPFFSPLLVSYGFFLLFVESSHSSFNSLRFHFSLECSWFLGMLILGFGCSF